MWGQSLLGSYSSPWCHTHPNQDSYRDSWVDGQPCFHICGYGESQMGYVNLNGECPSRALLIFFFLNLAQLGHLEASQIWSMEEAAKGLYAWLFHRLWWSCKTWLLSMSNSHVTSGRSPFPVSFQEVRRSIPLSFKIRHFAFLSSSK